MFCHQKSAFLAAFLLIFFSSFFHSNYGHSPIFVRNIQNHLPIHRIHIFHADFDGCPNLGGFLWQKGNFPKIILFRNFNLIKKTNELFNIPAHLLKKATKIEPFSSCFITAPLEMAPSNFGSKFVINLSSAVFLTIEGFAVNISRFVAESAKRTRHKIR
jgi:hypothetical protein